MAKYQPTVELMPIDQIHPYDKNAKIHTESQIQSLVEVIKSQGWDVPIVVDKHGSIIKGHGRRLAAIAMGLTEVPVIVRRDLTDAQVKAARLSDNRVAMGDFDVDAIKDELAALKTDGFDLSTTGFGDKELEMMLGELDKVDFDVFDIPDARIDSVESRVDASQSTPGSDPDETDTSAAPVGKALSVIDLLGFKQVPAEYKDDLISFMANAAEEFEEADPVLAFCKAIRKIVGAE